MSQSSKVVLGICTFLPLLFVFGLVFNYLAMLPGLIQTLSNNGDANVVVPEVFARFFSAPVVVLILLFMITKISLLIYYIIHVVSNGTTNEKVLWILLFVLLGSIPFIVYFFVKIVPVRAKNETAGAI